MENKFKCEECGGSGQTSKRPEGYFGDRLIWSCPTCQGSGYMVLAVEKYPDIVQGIESRCPPYRGERRPVRTQLQPPIYRPLTSEELEELLNDVIPDGPNWYELLVKGRLEVNYKGAPVTLIPGG
jgi:hypothetical protein